MANYLLKIPIFFALLSTLYCNLDAVSNSTGKKKLKILVNNPGLSFSHMQFQGKLADVLVEASHEVQNPLVGDYNGTFKAHRIIRGSMSHQKKDDVLKMSFITKPFEGSTNWVWNGLLDSVRTMSANLCGDILKLHQPLLRELATENYDVGISEAYDPCFFGILHAMGVKTKIATFAIAMTNRAGAPFGVPNVPSFVINYFAPSVSGPNMNFLERTLNLYSFAQEYFIERDKIYSMEQQFFNDAYGLDFPSLWSITKSVSLCFVNGNEFFELPRPLSNKIIHIGGIATGVFEKAPAKKVTLSPDIQSIFENAKDGVVLFSFGTITNTKVMSQEMKRAFLKAFAQFPTYDFIWKIEKNENDSEIFLNALNVHIFGWFEQKAILAQPKLKAKHALEFDHKIDGKQVNVKAEQTLEYDHKIDGKNVSGNKELDEKYRIFVGGLSKGTNGDTLHRYFSKFGDIFACDIVRNETNLSKGFGYVIYKSQDSIDSVLNSQPPCIDDKVVTVKHAHLRQRELTLFIGKLLPKTTDESLREHFSKYGQLTQCNVKTDPKTGQSRGFGYVSFESQEELNRALNDQHVIDGVEVRKIDKQTQELDLMVESLPQNMSEESLKKSLCDFFSRYGRVRDCRFIKNSIGRTTAFISMFSRDEISRALAGRPHRIDTIGKLVDTHHKGEQFTLIVNRLPKNGNNEDLYETFSKVGNPVHWEVKCDPKTNRSFGYGYVSFSSAEELSEFLVDKVLDRRPYSIHGQEVTVQRKLGRKKQ